MAGSILWALSPAVCFGVLTPATFLIAWVRRLTVGTFLAFAGYTAVWIWIFNVFDGPLENLAMVVHFLVLWGLGTVHAFVIRKKVWYPDSALATALRSPAPVDEPGVLHGEIVDPPPEAPSPPPAEHEPPSPDSDQTAEPDSSDEASPDEPMLGRDEDEPVIALVALKLLDAGNKAIAPLARFEQRFFGDFRPDREELWRFADRGSARIERLFETDPAAAAAACDRAETVLVELGADWLNFEFEDTEADVDDEPDRDRPEEPVQSEEFVRPEEPGRPEEEPPAKSSAFGEPTIGERVCESATYRDHVLGLRRFPDSSVVANIIDAAQNAGGVLTAAEVGRIAGRPTSSVDGYVSQLQRALNIDGAQVLSKQDDGASIRLDLELLRQQFLGGHR